MTPMSDMNNLNSKFAGMPLIRGLHGAPVPEIYDPNIPLNMGSFRKVHPFVLDEPEPQRRFSTLRAAVECARAQREPPVRFVVYELGGTKYDVWDRAQLAEIWETRQK